MRPHVAPPGRAWGPQEGSRSLRKRVGGPVWGAHGRPGGIREGQGAQGEAVGLQGGAEEPQGGAGEPQGGSGGLRKGRGALKGELGASGRGRQALYFYE
jgi:hypothetical protein